MTTEPLQASGGSGARRSLHIAILGSRGYPSTYGGFETLVRRLAPWLARRGHSVTVYGRATARRREEEVDGVRVVETRGLDRKAAGTPTHGLSAAIDCLRTKPDVVLVLNVANGPVLPLLRARQIPIAVNVDGIEWERGKWGRTAKALFRFGARLSARWADLLIADSREVQRRWDEEFAVRPQYIPYGAEVPHRRRGEGLARLGLREGSYVLAVARLVPENNIDLLLDSVARLDGAPPLVIVGSANYRNHIEERLRQLPADGHVVWLGHVEDQDLLDELWSGAGVYFHGHSVGGTNPALLQALACGAPTIALDTPYNREVLGTAGVLVPGNPRVVAREISSLMGDAARRLVLGAASVQVIAARYGWEEVLSDYETALVALASRPGRAPTGTHQ